MADLCNPLFQGLSKEISLACGIARRTEGIVDLLRGKLTQQRPNPSNITAWNVPSDPVCTDFSDKEG